MSEKLLMKGNEAIAEAAIQAGCRHFFGYPITPQTELAAYMSKRMPKLGGTYLQAESEIAAINMVIGASAAGARVMTSSSSPGVALKSEGISYLVGCDLPAVIVNIQRGGPGLGGIQPSQADYFMATKGPGHGDSHLIVLAPSTIQEIVDLIGDAFDMADIYRTPVMILGDGILGQMMEPVVFGESSKREIPEKTWAADGKPKEKRNIINSLYLMPEELEQLNLKRFERYEYIEEHEAKAEEFLCDDAETVIVAYGATARIAKNVVQAQRAKGEKVGLIRPITLWPFPKKVLKKAAASAKRMLVVEMSMGQMVDDVKLAIDCAIPVAFCGRTGGMVPTPDDITAALEQAKGGK